MKLITVIISAMLATYSVAVAQGNPSGRGSMTGDPAASTANPRAQPGGTVGASSANPAEVARQLQAGKTTMAIKAATRCPTAT